MATLCDVRQEIREILDKHQAKLVIQHQEDIPDEACWIEVQIQSGDLIGSTMLY